jgi:hypothetical protein
MLFTPIDIQRYNEDAVYVNHYGDHMGDFHWCFTPEKRFLFKDLITSIDNGNYHQQHYWIRDFVRKFTEVSYKQDEIKAGVDEEVLRQVKYSGIPFSETARFGVKFDQYQSYDVIK